LSFSQAEEESDTVSTIDFGLEADIGPAAEPSPRQIGGPGLLPRGEFQVGRSPSPLSSTPSSTSEESGLRQMGGPGTTSSGPRMMSPLPNHLWRSSLGSEAGSVDSPVSVLDLEGAKDRNRRSKLEERMGSEVGAEQIGAASEMAEGHRRALSGGSAGSSGRKSSRERLHEASTDHNTKSARRRILDSEEYAVDMAQRYVGHCNTGTDIKQASFLGQRGEFVASGSDDGRWFVWDARTGRLVKVLVGDENVVNCVQAHPFDCAVATSGIDDTIKVRGVRGLGLVGACIDTRFVTRRRCVRIPVSQC
jgi:WD and tetratricopeptide repeat-containing protein 1